MSHTDKDRPYWVKLNDDADSTQHDHLLLGRKTYRDVPIKDKHGNFVYETAYIESTADEILARFDFDRPTPPFRRYNRDNWLIIRYNAESLPGTWTKAYQAHSAGHGDELIVTHVYQKPVTEKVLWISYKDYCTAGEKDNRPTWRGGPHLDQLPCTPEVTGVNWRKLYTSNKPGLKKDYSRLRYSSERAVARDVLKGVINRYNSGEDIDDFNELPLTGQHRHSMAWDLY